ncbi:Apolipoprotein N-acyltransferase [Marinomonas spartinae]|uniref:apolipoprotein N-acyltransferase n=1 Tax=Marinomonas spartinae TaxID=1792290 RepID=UPI000809042D|nr:apolipoprotein N-acyltransferase [Marinomonas spartinae]SBS32229.1 Apolipoprotein N-acyltransferase [Marinomonas spartinae]
MPHSHPKSATSKQAGWKRPFLTKLPSPVALCIGFLAGALGVTSFSPFNFWPSYFITIVVFCWLVLTSDNAKSAAWRGTAVGLGFFGCGVSWVFVSIDTYGHVGNTISALITFGFVFILTLFWTLSSWVTWRLVKIFTRIPPGLIFATSLLAFEYARSTFFTGFPWLLPGYSIQTSWLYELLPIGGIWLTSAIVVLTSSIVTSCILSRHNHAVMIAIVLLAWLGAAYLQYFSEQWVKQTGQFKATLVQGNVKQSEKWQATTARSSLEYYESATVQHLDSDLVVWPETAITYLYQQIRPHLSQLNKLLIETNTTLVTGVPSFDKEKNTYYNAMWALGDGKGLYYKRHLVPFGEYIPFSSIIGPVLDIFGMPMSTFSPGGAHQGLIHVGKWKAAPFICYEIVYTDQVRDLAAKSDFLINISNDGWFGASIGPWQHLQIAQFRAKETGRYLVRATNTGLTVVVNENGKITDEAPQFKRTTMTTTVKTFSGSTPYVKWGEWPVVLLMILCLVLSYGINRGSKPSDKR